MIGAISANEMLAAAFGPGVVPRGPSVDRARIDPVGRDVGPHAAREDTVEFSAAGRSFVEGGSGASSPRSAGSAHDPSPGKNDAENRASRSKPGFDRPLAPEEEKQVRELEERDREVRRHEQAHKAAAGELASGGPKFEYEAGPDGKRYAVGGEVSIDTSPVPGDPRATIQKMQQVRRAALAPGEPSSQDRAVAARAGAAERQARAELAEQRKQSSETGETRSPGGPESSRIKSLPGATVPNPYQSITSAASVVDITA
jgi:hypothetical protein